MARQQLKQLEKHETRGLNHKTESHTEVHNSSLFSSLKIALSLNIVQLKQVKL